ncbi:hypothetical protein PR003_g24249 [Phytophthora rubi]|uniref:Uncharacterized protein n=1 Tax=Phytophthora rubi TaxID=129364 RepID=A0A6A4CPP6_9STRA|nr:hypothetical protein PR001_g7289 [Phytophthora rubi]KAE9294473.1 hypothetical protein PR003_g24249 [Phytophthora rubi]
MCQHQVWARAASERLYCTVEAVCNVDVASRVAALPPAAAASWRSAAGIGVRGVEVPDTARGVLVAAGSKRDTPAPPDVVFALSDPEVAVDGLLDTAGGALDVVGTLVKLPIPGSLTLPCAVSEVVVDETGATRAAGVPCSVGACSPSPEEEAESCGAAMTISDMSLGTARMNCECDCCLSCGVAEY